MDTTLPPIPLPNSRRDFIQAHKKELIILGVLLGLFLLFVIYIIYRRFTSPATMAPTVIQLKQPAPTVTQVKTQQMKAPQLTPPIQVKTQQVKPSIQVKKQQKFPRLNKVKQLNSNLPNISNQIPTGFSNQFTP